MDEGMLDHDITLHKSRDARGGNVVAATSSPCVVSHKELPLQFPFVHKMARLLGLAA